MNEIKYPDEFLDYLIDNIVLPYIENNKTDEETTAQDSKNQKVPC